MKLLREFVNNFKMALRTKKKIFITKHKIILIKIFQFLYSKGWIKNYEVKNIHLIDKNESIKRIKKKVILVHFLPSSSGTQIIDIHNSLVNGKESVTYEDLIKNKRKDFIILLSTSMGIMTDSEAMRHQRGGIVLCVFEIS